MTHLPEFYHPEKVGRAFVPDMNTIVAHSAKADLSHAHRDERRVILLMVDPQIDFVHEDGALSVPGAVADTRRTVEWIYRNIEDITSTAASLDSHIPSQIFFSTWWKNEQDNHPDPFTPITSAEVEVGYWKPVFEAEWSRQYVRQLETAAKKELMIWPYHTLIGTPGHTITPALYEAIAYHAAGRQSRPTFVHKGSIPKTEHYSLLEPEVKVPDHPQGDLNTAFLSMLAGYDLIYVAGQAKSHCVLETVTSVMRYYHDQPGEIAKWRVLTDCMSSVAHPVIDFEALANEQLAAYVEQGLTLVTSDDPIG